MEYRQSATKDRIDSGNRKFETIRQLAKRHMMDQYHTTTDEELKNAVVEVDINLSPEFRAAEGKAKSSVE